MKSLVVGVLILVPLLSETQVVAQRGFSTVIAHPGQDVELLCDVTSSGNGSVAWIIDNMPPHGVGAIRGGIVPGYSNDLGTNSLIIESIMMDDDRNDTEHQCVIAISDIDRMDLLPVEGGNVTILYVAGVPAMVPNVTAEYNTRNVNGSNIVLRLSWREPFNNLDPVVNYTVSCSGDVTCPQNFTTTDNAVLMILTTMTTYTFSVVATNSIGSGEAGVLMITTPPGNIEKVSGVSISCSPINLIVRCTTAWNPVTQGDITGYQVYYNRTMMNVDSSTTTLTFNAPLLPDGVFTGTVVVMVTAVIGLVVGPASDPAIARINSTSVSDAMAVVNSLQSITVTCTIHPNSTADQCVVIAMDDSGVNRTGNSPVANKMGVVTVNGLECGTNYTIIAGGTLNGVLVGPRSSHGHISTNSCSICPAIACEPCDSNNNNAAIIGAIVGVDCTVIIIIVITNIMIWIYCFRKRDFRSKEASSELHKPTKDTVNPAYHTITDERMKTGEEPVSYEDVNRPPEVKMTPNPAYAVP